MLFDVDAAERTLQRQIHTLFKLMYVCYSTWMAFLRRL